MMPAISPVAWRWVAVPVLAAALGGYAAWHAQALRIDAVKLAAAQEKAQLRADLEAAHAAALQAARAKEQVFQTKINKATHEHQATLARSRAQAHAARAELERLRHDLAAPYRLPDLAGGTGDVHPDPARELLGACAATYLDLAQQADGHAADAQLLFSGWPK